MGLIQAKVGRVPGRPNIRGENPKTHRVNSYIYVSSDKLAHMSRGKLVDTRSRGGQGRNLDILVKTDVSYHSDKKKKMTLSLIMDNPRGGPSVRWFQILHQNPPSK